MTQQMLTKNFSRKEMSCHHCGVCLMRQGFMDKLQEVRDKWGKPIHVTSGYRCPDHNRNVGGARDSQHVRGNAADLAYPANSPFKEEFIELLRQVFPVVVKGPGFVHVDLSQPRQWSYKNGQRDIP